MAGSGGGRHHGHPGDDIRHQCGTSRPQRHCRRSQCQSPARIGGHRQPLERERNHHRNEGECKQGGKQYGARRLPRRYIQHGGYDHRVGRDRGNGNQENGLVHGRLVDAQNVGIQPPEQDGHRRPDDKLAEERQPGEADIARQPPETGDASCR
ncbi:hypothetical protein H1P_6430008 [Hyella patelloides LEGE 07179]|uniref:Uncharacterized protein n=1 Tax=Hyella patelloides LEGE 07179 TaxID=945734 RepID=A0A563W270_9CYAN|nr:hypothetical protein H1P_6430008 [Hyella patelloides LEGE 07179]